MGDESCVAEDHLNRYYEACFAASVDGYVNGSVCDDLMEL
jgi:hypothetical protein